MSKPVVLNLLKVYFASRAQESSSARNWVRLIGWALVGGLTWYQGGIEAEEMVLILGAAESLAALIGGFLPDIWGRRKHENSVAGAAAADDRLHGGLLGLPADRQARPDLDPFSTGFNDQ